MVSDDYRLESSSEKTDDRKPFSGRQHSTETECDVDSNLKRRSVLKLIGIGSIPFVAGNASASKPDTGYGVGGYGTGEYGGGNTDTETGTPPLENIILFDGLGTTGVSEYEFSVTGAVEKSNASGASINGEDIIDDGRVTGSLASWRDAFMFSGELETLTIDGRARVFVNGEQVDPTDYGGDRSQMVTIVGNGNYSEYELASSGSISVIEGDGVDAISEGYAAGSIERGFHQLRLTGELTDFTFLEGGTQAYLDMERIDPEDYSDNEELSNTIVFNGTETLEQSSYSFTVDGNVQASENDDAAIDETDTVDGTRVSGAVEAGTKDVYRFEGSIIDFKLAGNATVNVNYE